jgi:magnesium transporter
MTIEYVDLKKTMTVSQALNRVKQTGTDKETVYTCYVLDAHRKLQGIVSLRRLVLASEYELVSDIMETEFFKAGTNDDQEEIADMFRKYGLSAMPVVDAELRLIGIITVDDVLDVIEQENTEDFEKMAAMAPSDGEYLDAGVLSLAKKRIFWLLILTVSATFTGGIIANFESLLSSAVVLTTFIPMIMSSGGNAGSQSSTLIIRGMALGEIDLKDWSKVLWKEFRVSALVGFILAIVNGLRMLIMGNSEWPIILTVSITVMFTVMLAKLIGGVLPILARAVKLDPTIMAGPMITTIVDAVSLVIYFSIAGVFIL